MDELIAKICAAFVRNGTNHPEMNGLLAELVYETNAPGKPKGTITPGTPIGTAKAKGVETAPEPEAFTLTEED